MYEIGQIKAVNIFIAPIHIDARLELGMYNPYIYNNLEAFKKMQPTYIYIYLYIYTHIYTHLNLGA